MKNNWSIQHEGQLLKFDLNQVTIYWKLVHLRMNFYNYIYNMCVRSSLAVLDYIYIYLIVYVHTHTCKNILYTQKNNSHFSTIRVNANASRHRTMNVLFSQLHYLLLSSTMQLYFNVGVFSFINLRSRVWTRRIWWLLYLYYRGGVIFKRYVSFNFTYDAWSDNNNIYHFSIKYMLHFK